MKQMVAFSKDKVDARGIEWHVDDDRKRHTHRGYIAVVFVTALGAFLGWFLRGSIGLTCLAFFVASAITAAFINSERDVYHRRSSSLDLDE